MQLPLSLLEHALNKPIVRVACAHAQVVYTKNGWKYNGTLDRCDRMMNIHLRRVTGERAGEKYTIEHLVIRGVAVRSFAVDQDILRKTKK